MKYPTIRIEGSILSADILDKIQQGDLLGQKPKDFWLKGNAKVKDEIVKAWADAQDMWRIFQRKTESIPETKTGTSETRNYWMVPMLSLLGYDMQLYRSAQNINNKNYAISHNASNLDAFPIHIMGFNDSLDKKRRDSGPRMSPHALVQEYINLNEHLYALVTNGLTIRLLRDSSRLIKLSFLEFDLERMFNEDHYTDFAIMYRLLHASRMPRKQAEGAESLIEGYHQDSLDSGSRIREGLSEAVEQSIIALANGFLSHPDNETLRQNIAEGRPDAVEYYSNLLHLIYRLLFLMVIEERGLIFEDDVPKAKRDIYYDYYSINRVRNLSEKRYLAEAKYNDLWISIKNTFRLFETEYYGEKLQIKPLAGDLFSSNSIEHLNNCSLDNKVLLNCLKNLSLFTNPNTGQIMRVNYGSLNTEEFGSVYENLLEYDPHLEILGKNITFSFKKGTGRSSSGSHYTPDELVQPLIKHSLDYIIEDKLKEPDPEKTLLSITVCDVACGSGHILLNAARRIGSQLAKVRTGEDQPSPSAFRQAVRDAIQHCIYGVDKNPLAVELAKVALWLEAHNPGEPLNFLDHHIKCGDAIVGLAHKEELQNGIADEAFKKLPGDDKDICKELRDRNKLERKRKQEFLDFSGAINKGVTNITELFHELDTLPENTPKQIEDKRKKYKEITSGTNYWNLKLLADIMTAQFFIPKTADNQRKIITDAQYRNYLRGSNMQNQAVAEAMGVASQQKFFHWFLEFPEVFQRGGFDCILGNPPYLGGKKISGFYGDNYLNYLIDTYQPSGGLTDLIIYFVKRIYNILNYDMYSALISTNSLYQGDSRVNGIDNLLQNENLSILMGTRSMKWPGTAQTYIATISFKKGKVANEIIILDNKEVDTIGSYFVPFHISDPYTLSSNEKKSFIGSVVNGSGFIIAKEYVKKILDKSPNEEKVICKYINGSDVNNNIDLSPSRWIINFHNWNEKKAKQFPLSYSIIKDKVYPERQKKKDKGYREKWWLYARRGNDFYESIKDNRRVLVRTQASKHNVFEFVKNGMVYDQKLVGFAFESFNKYSILNSNIHETWVYQFCGDFGGILNYSPSHIFETFPFPQNLLPEMEAKLERIGEEYHEFRRELMQKLQLGLTKTYNQFHNAQLTSEIVSSQVANSKESEVASSQVVSSKEKSSNGYSLIANCSLSKAELTKKYGKDTYYLWNHLQKTPGTCSMEEAIAGIIKLRQLHKEMDEAVLEAYGWGKESEVASSQVASSRESEVVSSEGESSNRYSLITNPSNGSLPINLNHDFYEVDYLPENDRVRYTISPEARKEVLKRLLLLNHKIYEEEVKQGLHNKKGKAKNKKQKSEKPKFMKKTVDLTKAKPKPKPKDKSQMDLFSTISEPEPETAPAEERILTSFHVGQHVFHDKFGEGEILHIAGDGETAKLTVKFGKEMKKLVAGYAKLRRV